MPEPPPYPSPGGNGYVTWGIYLDDRRQAAERLTRIERKLDRVLDRQEKLELAAAHDDGQEVAEAAAEVALDRRKRSRREVLRDVMLATFSAALAVVGALIVAYLTGSAL